MPSERSLSFLWHTGHLALVGVLVIVTAIGWKWSWDHRAASVECHLT